MKKIIGLPKGNNRATGQAGLNKGTLLRNSYILSYIVGYYTGKDRINAFLNVILMILILTTNALSLTRKSYLHVNNLPRQVTGNDGNANEHPNEVITGVHCMWVYRDKPITSKI